MKFLAVVSLLAAVSSAAHVQLTCSKEGISCNTSLSPQTGCCRNLECVGSTLQQWGKCVQKKD